MLKSVFRTGRMNGREPKWKKLIQDLVDKDKSRVRTFSRDIPKLDSSDIKAAEKSHDVLNKSRLKKPLSVSQSHDGQARLHEIQSSEMQQGSQNQNTKGAAMINGSRFVFVDTKNESSSTAHKITKQQDLKTIHKNEDSSQNAATQNVQLSQNLVAKCQTENAEPNEFQSKKKEQKVSFYATQRYVNPNKTSACDDEPEFEVDKALLALSATNISINLVQTNIKLNVEMKRPGFIHLRPNNKELMIFLSAFPKDKVFYSAKKDEWVIDPEFYQKIHKSLKKRFKFSEIPAGLISAFIRHANRPVVNYVELSAGVRQKLLPFQLEAVRQAVYRNGRILLADEMGLGKTYQALGIADFYRLEWPFLVICPASMVQTWCTQILAVLGIEPTLCSSTQDIRGTAVVCSYNIASKLHRELKLFKFLVVLIDECHYIKNHASMRARHVEIILAAAHRIVFMSGTPATSRPVELFSVLTALHPGLFKNLPEYATRYCNRRRIGSFFDNRGCSNSSELLFFLETLFMLRRTKQDVLQSLPQKQRRQLILRISPKDKDNKGKNEHRHIAHNSNHPSAINNTFVQNHLNNNKDILKLTESDANAPDPTIMQMYSAAAITKIPAVCAFLKTLIAKNIKFVIFAHHATMLDALQSFLSSKTNFIRIDGKTSASHRQKHIDAFQNDENIRVALLSITACSAGLTLTAGKALVFAELYWNPGIMLQAEDRIHRIGQRDDVNIYYLTATHTVDELVWPILLKKLCVLEKCGVGKNELKNIENEVVDKEKITQFCVVDEFVPEESLEEVV